MGINLGALWSPIICGNLGEKVSFALGFGSAAVGMTAGLIQFLRGQKYLGSGGLPPGRASQEGDAHTQKPVLLLAKDYVDVVIWMVGTCALVWGVLFAWKFVGPMWATAPSAVKGALSLGALGLMFFGLFKGSNKQEAQELGVIVILCLFNIFFWMGFEQAGGTMTLFADEQTDRNVGGIGMLLIAAFVLACAYNFRRSTKDQQSGKGLWLALTGMFVLAGVGAVGLAVYDLATGKTTDIPASQFQAINPLLIVALAPTFSNMWDRLDNSKYKTSTPTKMAIGMIILGLGFLVLYTGQKIATATGGKASSAWLVAVYTIHTVGELCLSPIGLSMVTKLAPPRVSSLAMGFWLWSSAVANYLAGTLESILEKSHMPIYAFLTASSIGPALLLLALTPLLKKMMHGKA
jgi:POT family proton-dependent oligopeptide transporter